MVEIPLTQGKIAIVDDKFAHLMNYKWHFSRGYAVKQMTIGKGKQRNTYLHHCIIGYPLHNLETDHIDNDGLNNAESNLRNVTKRENLSNQKRQKEGKTSSRFPGVCWYKRDRKWQAQIQIDKNLKFLGRFPSESEAYDAYLIACKEVERRSTP